MYLAGATTFVVTPSSDTVAAACLFVLDTSRNVRWYSCDNGFASEGTTAVSTQAVYANEYIVGQASYSCPCRATQSCVSPYDAWEWQAYMWVW